MRNLVIKLNDSLSIAALGDSNRMFRKHSDLIIVYSNSKDLITKITEYSKFTHKVHHEHRGYRIVLAFSCGRENESPNMALGHKMSATGFLKLLEAEK